MSAPNGRSSAAVMAMALLVALSACQKQEGPAEKAGKEIDTAVEKAGEKVNEAGRKVGLEVEKAGEKIQDAAKRNKK